MKVSIPDGMVMGAGNGAVVRVFAPRWWELRRWWFWFVSGRKDRLHVEMMIAGETLQVRAVLDESARPPNVPPQNTPSA